MTTSKFVNMPARELKKGLKSVIRKSNEDQRAIMDKYKEIMNKKNSVK